MSRLSAARQASCAPLQGVHNEATVLVHELSLHSLLRAAALLPCCPGALLLCRRLARKAWALQLNFFNSLVDQAYFEPRWKQRVSQRCCVGAPRAANFCGPRMLLEPSEGLFEA